MFCFVSFINRLKARLDNGAPREKTREALPYFSSLGFYISIVPTLQLNYNTSNRAKINAVINFYKRLIVWRLKFSPLKRINSVEGFAVYLQLIFTTHFATLPLPEIGMFPLHNPWRKRGFLVHW